jgi:hypothetical protein
MNNPTDDGYIGGKYGVKAQREGEHLWRTSDISILKKRRISQE